MNIDLGQLSFDEELVVRQLKQDFRDDWFPDPIGFSDFIDEGLLSKIISDNLKDNHGAYVPSQALLLNVPKGNFTLRYALETSVADRVIYHALAAHLLPHFDKAISWRVFSHRQGSNAANTTGSRSDAKYTFRNPIAAWGDFVGCVQSSVQPDTALLSTDLANYFENINLAKLKAAMTELIPQLEADTSSKASTRFCIDQLFTYLTSWAFSKERGLPQNRDASSFLANIYMRSVDCTMIEKGYNYFRYMDDIKIVCSNIHDARRALKDLILCLRPIGQVVNSGKTQIVHSSNEEEIRKCLTSGSPELKRINAAWQSKSLKQILRSFLPLKDLALKTLLAKRYDSRDFRFCVSRLETLARCDDFSIPDGYFEDITPLIINGLDEAPVATDQVCKYLRAVSLSDDQLAEVFSHLTEIGKSFYNWKNYQIWILLTQKAYKSGAALDFARETIRGRPDDPTRAGATVFLGAMGDTNDRALIAEHFSSLSTFIGQRSAIIAVQELHFRSGRKGGASIDSHVSQHVRKDLKGSYRALNRKGIYVSELEPISISRFVDWERDYD